MILFITLMFRLSSFVFSFEFVITVTAVAPYKVWQDMLKMLKGVLSMFGFSKSNRYNNQLNIQLWKS